MFYNCIVTCVLWRYGRIGHVFCHDLVAMYVCWFYLGGTGVLFRGVVMMVCMFCGSDVVCQLRLCNSGHLCTVSW